MLRSEEWMQARLAEYGLDDTRANREAVERRQDEIDGSDGERAPAHFYADAARARLEELREILRSESESPSYGELAELQDLAEHIEAGDVELLEPAGVPEDVAYDPDLLAAYHRSMREED